MKTLKFLILLGILYKASSVILYPYHRLVGVDSANWQVVETSSNPKNKMECAAVASARDALAFSFTDNVCSLGVVINDVRGNETANLPDVSYDVYSKIGQELPKISKITRYAQAILRNSACEIRGKVAAIALGFCVIVDVVRVATSKGRRFSFIKISDLEMQYFFCTQRYAGHCHEIIPESWYHEQGLNISQATAAGSVDNVANMYACHNLCQQNVDCDAFMYTPDGTKTCSYWNYAAAHQGLISMPGFHTGTRLTRPDCTFYHTKYVSSTNIGELTNVTNVEECQMRCRLHPGCNFIEYYTNALVPARSCFLKSEVGDESTEVI